MVSIAKAVEEVIEERPFLQESLVKGIINYGALADELQERVEKKVQREVKRPAVMMALRRLADRLEEKAAPEIHFPEDSSLLVRDGLIEVTVNKNEGTRDKIRELFDKVDYGKGDVLTMTQGMYEITVITNKKYASWLKENFGEDDIITFIEGLSALTLTIPLDFVDTPGFFYIISKALAWQSVNVTESVSTAQELTLIIESDEVSRAFDVLKELMENH